MTWFQLYFENEINSVAVAGDLLKLPEIVRPIYFTATEDRIIKKQKFSNKEEYKKFLKRNGEIGFHLYPEKRVIAFHIDSSGYKYNSNISIEIKDESLHSLVPNFFRCLSKF